VKKKSIMIEILKKGFIILFTDNVKKIDLSKYFINKQEIKL